MTLSRLPGAFLSGFWPDVGNGVGRSKKLHYSLASMRGRGVHGRAERRFRRGGIGRGSNNFWSFAQHLMKY